MPTVGDVIEFLKTLAPLDLAEEWDNVGLLIGDDRRDVRSILTCLTLTPDVAAEAIAQRAELIVTHHPVMFRPIQKLTTATSEGRMLLDLVLAGVSVYCAHTAYDSALRGVNRQLADQLGLRNIMPLRSKPSVGNPDDPGGPDPSLGAGRCGNLAKPMPLHVFLAEVKQRFGLEQVQYVAPAPATTKKPRIRASLERLQYVANSQGTITRVGIACGSAAEFLRDAIDRGCEAFITGEARFHDCLEARSLGIAMVLLGHYGSERPALEHLATIMQTQFKGLTIRASQAETDPLQWA